MLWLKKNKVISRKIMALLLVWVMMLSLSQPLLSIAQTDDFPLPEDIIDDVFPTPEQIAGNEGSTGSTGTQGTDGNPSNLNGEDGINGDDSPASYAAHNEDGSSTASGSDGQDAQPLVPGSGASGSSGGMYRGRAANVYIKTGDASAYASIVNFLNTTILGSRNLDIINIYGSTLGTLDFSDFNPTSSTPIGASSSGTQPFLGAANSPQTTLDIDNNANLLNNLTLGVGSGSNRAVGANGNVIIETGDVEVDASVFNMVNTSLIGKNWKFKVINIFSDVVGDLILPTLETQRSAAGCSGCLSAINISTTNNSADVTNHINVNANSGGNTAAGSGGATYIQTGDVTANASIVNMVDTTIVGDDWYYTRFHVAGDWRGSVYNTNSTAAFIGGPHDLSIRDEGVGSNSSSMNDFVQRLFDPGSSVATTNNNGTITNVINIDANSGDNEAQNTRGDVAIKTGDVRANTAVTNVANTTIIGDGWQFYLVNIFGNWRGSAHYGMPDLAVSEVAVPEATPARRGNKVKYVYSYTNGGDTTATDVVLRDRYDADKVHVTDTNGGVVRGNTITWRIGRLAPRETRVLSYTTTVNAPDGSLPIQNEVTISASNSDRDLSNNTTGAQVLIAAANGGSNGGSGGSSGGTVYYYSGGTSSTSNPEFNLVKGSDREIYAPGETIPFAIILDNFKPYSGFAVGVVDQFMSPENTVLMTKSWDLGEVVGFEHIEITYAIPIPLTAMPGPYLNQVVVFSKNAQGEILPKVLTTLPITITAKNQLNVTQSTPTLPNAFVFGTFETSTATSTSSFAPVEGTIKRKKKTDDAPVVLGYSSEKGTSSGAGSGVAHASSTHKKSSFLGSLFYNLRIWLLLTLLGMGALALQKNMKRWFRWFFVFGKKKKDEDDDDKGGGLLQPTFSPTDPIASLEESLPLFVHADPVEIQTEGSSASLPLATIVSEKSKAAPVKKKVVKKKVTVTRVRRSTTSSTPSAKKTTRTTTRRSLPKLQTQEAL